MSDSENKSDLEVALELSSFLQGNLPKGWKVPKKDMPKLTAAQAYTVIWYLGNLYRTISDYISACDLCGTLFDESREGDVLDYGRGPVHFCDSCMNSNEWYRKAKRNPDKAARPYGD